MLGWGNLNYEWDKTSCFSGLCLHEQAQKSKKPPQGGFEYLVDPNGLEPSTSAMSRQRSNQLSYGSASCLAHNMRKTEEVRILA